MNIKGFVRDKRNYILFFIVILIAEFVIIISFSKEPDSVYVEISPPTSIVYLETRSMLYHDGTTVYVLNFLDTEEWRIKELPVYSEFARRKVMELVHE